LTNDGDDASVEWVFDDPCGSGNLTGGDGDFAIADSDCLDDGGEEDTTLRTPVLDFSAQANVLIEFDSDRALHGQLHALAGVELPREWVFEADLDGALKGSECAVVAVPSVLRSRSAINTARPLAPAIAPKKMETTATFRSRRQRDVDPK
jgi:hypothetical protein